MATEKPRLVVSRCFNHVEREASARCVACGRFYCRECVAEHDGRMICAVCLRKESQAGQAPRRRGFAPVVSTVQVAAAVVVAWFVFYLAGQALLQVPAEFHEGTMWRGDWWREDE